MSAIVPSNAGDDHIGLAVVRSLGRKDISTTVISNEKRAMPFYSRYCTNKRISEYNSELLSELTEDDIIMPNGVNEMLFFAQNAPLYDYTLAYPDYETLTKIIDKSHLTQSAIQHQLPIPKTFVIDSPDSLYRVTNSLKYPVFIKPTWGAGGRGIIKVDGPDLLEERYTETITQYGPSIIQEYIPFKKQYASAVLINTDYEILQTCILQMNRTYPCETGPGCFVETVHDEEILNATVEILKDFKIWGIQELDFVIDERDGKPKLLEINPRFWGSLQGAISAGVDFPYLLYKLVADGDLPVSSGYPAGIKCRYLFLMDLRNLLTVLRGRHPFPYKLKTATDFVKFHQDDGYFIFSLSDMMPFISLFEYYFLKMIYHNSRNRSATTYK